MCPPPRAFLQGKAGEICIASMNQRSSCETTPKALKQLLRIFSFFDTSPSDFQLPLDICTKKLLFNLCHFFRIFGKKRARQCFTQLHPEKKTSYKVICWVSIQFGTGMTFFESEDFPEKKTCNWMLGYFGFLQASFPLHLLSWVLSFFPGSPKLGFQGSWGYF